MLPMLRKHISKTINFFSKISLLHFCIQSNVIQKNSKSQVFGTLMPPNSHFLVTINLHQIFKIKKLDKQSVNCPVVKVHFRCTTWKGLLALLALSSIQQQSGSCTFFTPMQLIDGRDDIDVSHGQFSKIIRLIHLLLLLTFFMTSTMQLLIQSIINFFSQFHSLFSSQRNC